MKNKKYIEQINNCIKEKWLSTVKGGYMEEFENKASKLFGNKYGVSTCNGTSALYLALFCLSLENNKNEIIIPSYGFHVSISVICTLGLKPVFCDVELDTFTLDFDKCKKLINKNTLAVMVLQPWGNIADLDKMAKLREKHKVFFISDSSHAHEATWNNKPIGNFFDINCASFGLGKLISGGELGVLTTDNPMFRDRALLFSHTNRVPDDLITTHYKNINNNVGIKFRPHLFALLLALDDMENNKAKRLRIKNNILEFQKEIALKTSKITFQKNFIKAERVFHMPPIILDPELNSRKIIEELNSMGFHTQTHNYKVSLNNNHITTDFYKIRDKSIYTNTEQIINKNIIQSYASDFDTTDKIKLFKKVLLKHASS
jgi:perosamine synthetase